MLYLGIEFFYVWFVIESFGALFRWAAYSIYCGWNLRVSICPCSRSVWQLCHTGWSYLLFKKFILIALTFPWWILETKMDHTGCSMFWRWESCMQEVKLSRSCLGKLYKWVSISTLQMLLRNVWSMEILLNKSSWLRRLLGNLRKMILYW